MFVGYFCVSLLEKRIFVDWNLFVYKIFFDLVIKYIKYDLKF